MTRITILTLSENFEVFFDCLSEIVFFPFMFPSRYGLSLIFSTYVSILVLFASLCFAAHAFRWASRKRSRLGLVLQLLLRREVAHTITSSF